MVSEAKKKAVVRTLVEEGITKVSEACRALSLPRASFYAPSSRSPENLDLEKQIVSLSHDNPRYGYRRITALLRRLGEKVNPKRVQATRRRHGLHVLKKQRRTRRVHENSSQRL